MGGERIDPLGALALVIATLSWASGSIYSRQARFTATPFLAAGMQMLVGGSVLIIAGLLTNELPRVHPSAISLKSVLSLVYLILIGAIVGYSAYLYLLRHSTPAKAATYAYVNPVVAVILGWAFAGEPLTPRMGIAAAVIVGGVALITIARQPRAAPGPAPSAAGLADPAADG